MSGYVVSVERDRAFVCSVYLSTANSPTIEFCRLACNAHQFDAKAAAEVVAFLVDGEVEVCP